MRKLILAAALTGLIGAASVAHAEYYTTRCWITGGPDEYIISIDTDTHAATAFVANAPARPNVFGSFRYSPGQGTYITFPKTLLFVAEPSSGMTSGAAMLDGSSVRIPTKPATHSNRKPATDSDLKPAGVPI
jgi:hypothetical protein